jgi:hypothetical protein
MAGTTQTIRIEIIGDGHSAERELKRTATVGEQSMRKLTQSSQRGSRQITNAHKAIGGSFVSMAKRAAAAGGAFVAAYASIHAAKDAITTTEALAKQTIVLHRNLGLSVKSASEWAAVARVRNIDAKALNMSFGTLSKNVELGALAIDKHRAKLDALGTSEKDQEKRQKEIAKGAGDQVDRLKQLGITQEQIKRGNFEEVLQTAARGFGKMHGGTERAALAMRLLGRGWQTVLPLFTQGNKSLNENLHLAQKYGATLDGHTVRSVADLIKAQRELQFAQLGWQITFATKVAPTLTKGILAIAHFTNGVRDGTGAGGRFADRLKEIWQKAKPLIGTLRDIASWLGRHPALIVAAAGAWVAYRVATSRAVGFAARAMRALFSGPTCAKNAAAAAGCGETAGAGFARRFGSRAKAGILAFGWKGLGATLGALLAAAIANKIGNAINDALGGGSTGKDRSRPGDQPGVPTPLTDFVKKHLPFGLGGKAAGGMVRAPMVLVGEEAPQYPEYVISTNPRDRARMHPLVMEAASAVGLARGGAAHAARTSPGGGGAASPGRTAFRNFYLYAKYQRHFERHPSHNDFANMLGDYFGLSRAGGGEYSPIQRVRAVLHRAPYADAWLGKWKRGDRYARGGVVGLARGGRWSKGELENLWVRAGGDPSQANLMAAIALAESAGNASVVNGIGATGLWQIHPGGSQYLDPLTNAKTAVMKLRTQGLGAWEVYTNGSYRAFLGGGGATAAGSGDTPSEPTGIPSGARAIIRALTPRLSGRAGRIGRRGAALEAGNTYQERQDRLAGGLSFDDTTEGGRAAHALTLGSTLVRRRASHRSTMRSLSNQKRDITRQIRGYRTVIRRLTKQLSSTRASQRSALRERIKAYQGRIRDLKGTLAEVGGQIADERIDFIIEEGQLTGELAGIAATGAEEAAATPGAAYEKATSHIDALVRAGLMSPEQGAREKANIAGQFIAGTGTAAGFGAAGGDFLLQLLGDIKEGLDSNTQSNEKLAAVLADSVEAQRAQTEQVAEMLNVSQNEYGALSRSLGLVASGYIGGKIGRARASRMIPGRVATY